ncbi:hypothetical protein EDD37DRAFT_443571 [Exophiala viscosa]|uniref:Zn(2)-C6 fungal-type domain-containing protein n=1 Tax=Exophiala viscosa TaxID=2486360 RepID=A0AAN6DUW5_9EURO|nr:hypothetical protein EDD36DRAFT_283210 [Exophiala viscosa]KAI1623901.1 hypothetical protein EDD37DRAFT_443571 [Exophiala viscosa]
MPSSEQRPKSRRITRACDYCHKRSIRCTSGNGSRCQSCIDFDQPCTYNRAAKRRGVTPRARVASPSFSRPLSVNAHPNPSSQSWRAPMIATQAVVMSLVEVYFEIVYPIFPLFHRPTYIRKISRGDYTTDKTLFPVTMAVCALVSARVRDQAIFNPSWDVEELSQTPSETFYDAAVQYCASCEDSKQTHSLDTLRLCALLALTAIQYGNIREMQLFLGKYHTLVAMDGLHDETNWPKDIGIVETEERRRLFWSMYTLEVYSSIIWNGITRCREQQVNVTYTTELDDEHFSDMGYNQPVLSPVDIGPSPGGRWGNVRNSSWLCGWNFTTDLYRVLEHVIANLRDRRRQKRTFLSGVFGDRPIISASAVRDSVMTLYGNLPACFKEFPEVTCDPSSDRYGFQAANITATVQLLRMMLFASGGGTIEERCKIASEVVDAFTRIPVAYLRAISSPLLHHLAGIGAILGSVLEEPLGDIAYQQVRVVLLSLAQLLENLDHGIHSAISAQRLRDLVAQIDGYWDQLHIRRAPDSQVQATDQDYYASQHSDAPRTIPSRLTTSFFDDWPWNLDLMQVAENWSSTDLPLDV